MVVIEKSYVSKFGEFFDKDVVDLAIDAYNGLECDLSGENAAVYVGNMLAGSLYNSSQIGSLIESRLRLGVKYFNYSVSCASGSVALYNAYRDLEAGVVDKAVVIGVEKMSDFSGCDLTEGLMGASHFYDEYLYGFTFTSLYGLMASAYLNEYKLDRALLDKVSAKAHKYGFSNPGAQFRFELSDSDFEKSAIVSDPFKLLNCSPFSDGAAALLLSSDGDGVKILDIEMEQDQLALKDRSSLISIDAVKRASSVIYSRNEISAFDIDVFEVHDCFAIAEAMAYEDLGLSEAGNGLVDAAEDKFKVNLSGGLKACGHPVGATGVKQVAYLAQHLSDSDDKLALAHNVAGTGSVCVLTLLEK